MTSGSSYNGFNNNSGSHYTDLSVILSDSNLHFRFSAISTFSPDSAVVKSYKK